MSEDDFSRLQGDSYRGSNYANFTGGGITPQGNVSSAATTTAANSTNTASDAPPTPTTPSQGLINGKPSISGAVIGAALPYAGQTIGAGAGAAIGSGASIGSGLSQGVSSLENKVSGGLVGEASTPANIIGNSGATQSTTAAYDAASKASDAGSFGSGANIGAGVGAGFASAAATLLQGGGIVKAAKVGVGTGLGTYAGTAIGTAVGGPIGGAVGGFIGGALGGALGGRVICTQLVRDGLLPASDQRLDMEYTFLALSNIHMRGYLFWARPWVRLMNRKPWLRDITHRVIVWRLDEIKFKMGILPKSRLRGKITCFVLEKFSFGLGLFLADTEESIIYKKENKHVPA